MAGTPNPPVKPGNATSEYKITCIIVALFAASIGVTWWAGKLDGTALLIATATAAGLSAAGYSVSRARVKALSPEIITAAIAGGLAALAQALVAQSNAAKTQKEVGDAALAAKLTSLLDGVATPGRNGDGGSSVCLEPDDGDILHHDPAAPTAGPGSGGGPAGNDAAGGPTAPGGTG